jgi:phage/plasmid-like protein (TIGR03299 family)
MIGAGCRYETAGSLKDGKLVWLLALTDSRRILGDEVQQYLTFATGHDGKTPVKVFDTSTRVVCANTFQLALRGAKRVWTFEHQNGVHEKLNEFRVTMENARNYMDSLEIRAQKLFDQKITTRNLNKIMNQVFGNEDEFEDQPMKQKRVQALKNRVITVYNEREDLQNFRGTAWGLYNSFADVAAHGTPTFNTGNVRERRLLSYIEGNKLLASAQKAIELVAA